MYIVGNVLKPLDQLMLDSSVCIGSSLFFLAYMLI